MKSNTVLNRILGVAGLLLLGTFAPTAFAQSATQDQTAPPATSEPAPRAHQRDADRYAGLNLSDDQKAQIKKIQQEAKGKADAIMSDSSLSDLQKKAKIKQIHRAAREHAHNVLTPEQREQLNANSRERHSERPASPSM